MRCEFSVTPGEEVVLSDAQRHHLAVVLRMKVGESLTLIDGDECMWQGRLVALEPMRVSVLESAQATSAEPRGELSLWLPLLKGGKTDDLVRQATELGASAITCFVASRSVARLTADKSAKRVARWNAIASEATRQCGRPKVPDVRFSGSLPSSGSGVYLWEAGGQPAMQVLTRSASEGVLEVLVGPEGGLSPQDASALDAAGWSPASLGDRVLRAETAVVAAVTLGMAALGEDGYAA